MPTAAPDTGSTGHFLALDTPNLPHPIVPSTNPISVTVPNGQTMLSTHTTLLDIPKLPKAARQAHLFPDMPNTSLLSVGLLCDAGCIATFTQNSVTITLDDSPILTGHRCPNTRLWKVPLNPPPKPLCNAILGTTKAAEMVAYSHATLFSPTLSTLQKALDNGYIQNFPGLTKESLKKYPPTSPATAKGHLDQTRANQQSTKSTTEDNFFPPNLETGNTTNACFAAIVEFSHTRQVHTDQTGKFPTTSKKGMKYVFVLYDYDSNSIHPVPIKNRSAEAILEAYKTIHSKLIKAGLRPKLH